MKSEKNAKQNQSEDIPLENLNQTTNSNANFKQNSNENSEQATSSPQQGNPSSTDEISDNEPSCSGTSPDKKPSEKFKKVSVSSIVQKWKNKVNKQDFLSQYRRRVSHQARLARVLLATVVTFVVCWAPFAFDAVFLGAGYTMKRPKDFELVSHWLAFTNALCNPIIYSLLNTRLKEAFKTILQGFWWKVYICKKDDDDEVFET